MSSLKRPFKTQRFFFQNNRLICSLGPMPRRLLGGNGLALAELGENTLSSQLLQTDDAKTPLLSYPGGVHQNYSPYGFLHIAPSASLVAYSGQRLDTLLNAYALGNGHRFYSPVLMRFFQPDGHSPFGKGGPNAYSYGQNDPINKHDPTGQWWEWMRRGIDWIKGLRPSVSVHRPIMNRGNGPEPSDHVNAILHTQGTTPSQQHPHISISMVDIDAAQGLVEQAAGWGNYFVRTDNPFGSTPGQRAVEEISTLAVHRIQRGVAAAGVEYASRYAMNEAGINSQAASFALQVATHGLLERRLLTAGVMELRTGNGLGRLPNDFTEW